MKNEELDVINLFFENQGYILKIEKICDIMKLEVHNSTNDKSKGGMMINKIKEEKKQKIKSVISISLTFTKLKIN
ncbi:MAG: hypothetical protein PHV06_10535 [bacterium]|nr:hypothetical protein [bacterium]